jgi:hypothetical protein
METRQPIALPSDVTDYIFEIFCAVDDSVARRIERQPNVHEESLDMTFVDTVSLNSGPHRTTSNTVVDIDIHWVGGGWHYERWEVADIGFIVTFRRLGELLRTKIVLLQSKRLYPRESEFVEAHGLARPGGFGYLAPVNRPGDVREPRLFRFDKDCRYRALQVGDKQWGTIANYESEFGIPVHYLLYHPGDLPCSVQVPVELPLSAHGASNSVGIRVLPASLLRAACTSLPRNYAPSFDELGGGADPGTWLPAFVVNDVLGCKEGYIPESFDSDAGVNRIFNLRGAPIAAAILIDIDLPADPQAIDEVEVHAR